MSKLDRIINDAVEHQNLPFAVAAVVDSAGLLWQGAAGNANSTQLAGPDTVFRLFSMTKGIGALAAIILVDRGQLSLDSAITSILPEFSEVQVLETMGPEGPVLRPPSRPVSVRHLLTNTAGFAYDWCSRTQALWQLVTGSPPPLTGSRSALNGPLMFDPGDDFIYGNAYDWLGPIIEKIDGRPIERFCQEEIFDPLGMSSTAFEADFAGARLADSHIRWPDGNLAKWNIAGPPHPEVYGLGQALYGTPADYVRFLRLVLGRGELDGQRIIKRESAELMMTDQMQGLEMPVVKSEAPMLSGDVDLCVGARKTWTAGFMRNETAVASGRSAGSLGWAGFFNTHYWIDPSRDVAAVFMTQLVPFCDVRLMDSYVAFERAVYHELNASSASSREAW